MPQITASSDMRLFQHHIYELRKGVRNMILHTMPKSQLDLALRSLQDKNIDYHIQMVCQEKCNLFFGKTECIEIIRLIVNKPLNHLTAEEDFILGVMLGYDVCNQCKRYREYKKVS